MVQAFETWKTTNHALGWTVWGAENAYKVVESIQCPVDWPFHAAENICKQVLSALGQALLAVKTIAEKVRTRF